MGDRPSDVAVLGGWIQNIVNVFSIWSGVSVYAGLCVTSYKKILLFSRFFHHPKSARGMSLRLLQGVVPIAFPKGVHYRVGPDPTSNPDGHLLDGQGRVDRVSFGAKVTLLSKRLVTPKDGRPTFGSGGSGFRLHNPANTSLTYHDSRLFALWEGGHPVEVHTETLETIATGVRIADARVGAPVSTGIGLLDSVLGFGGESVGSHPVKDPEKGHTALLMSTVCRDCVKYRIAEIDAKGTIMHERFFSIDGFTAVHGGMALTRDYYIICAPSLALDLESYIRGKCPIADCVSQLEGAPIAIHLIPRRSTARTATVLAAGCFVTHSVNAYQACKHNHPVRPPASIHLAHPLHPIT